ncbi:MAG: D-2-hydroxyacid dehydrogenase [Firmicutes bacterium]|nr:D-2-hydroxyacid dehydrogenase [Bacillota bacterium]
MKIVILDGNTCNPGDLSWEGFEQFGELTVYPVTDSSNPQEVIDRIGDAEIVINNKTLMQKDVLRACPNVKYIGMISTGYNAVDAEEAGRLGIPVTNIPGYGTMTVAQHAMALLLEVTNRVGHHNTEVKKGRWETSEDFTFWDYPLIELDGKTLGIIGYGMIGQAMGRMAQAMGMKLIVNSRHPKPEWETENCRYGTLDEIYAEADVISLHCPLHDGNKGMINKETIAKMKDGVILINSARGGLVVEQDLADALNSGKVYAAAVDTLHNEPVEPNNPLVNTKNCIITPHNAWAAKESRARIIRMAEENLAAFLKGEPRNVVNGVK